MENESLYAEHPALPHARAMHAGGTQAQIDWLSVHDFLTAPEVATLRRLDKWGELSEDARHTIYHMSNCGWRARTYPTLRGYQRSMVKLKKQLLGFREVGRARRADIKDAREVTADATWILRQIGRRGHVERIEKRLGYGAPCGHLDRLAYEAEHLGLDDLSDRLTRAFDRYTSESGY